jgi:sarcosine oxidase, subunit gamma
MVDAARRPPAVEPTPWLRRLEVEARFSFRGVAAAQQAAGAAFGVPLPATPCRAATAGGRAALWLGPDEQLLIAPVDEAEAVRTTISAALGSHPHSLVDISHRQLALELAGPRAGWLLNAGCPLDLDVAAFPVGMCTRTVFHKAEIVLWRTDGERFRLEVWRSFADYVVGMLHAVAREFAE